MKTRFTEATGIEIKHVAPGEWRHIDTNDGRNAVVGPAYKTHAEIMQDHEAYLRRGGWVKRPLSPGVAVFDLEDESTTYFDAATDRKYAVAYCYAMKHDRASWFFAHVHGKTLEDAYKELPIIEGKRSIACGEFATLKPN